MDWITDGIAIGGWYDGRNAPLLRREGILAVLQLHGQEGGEEFPDVEAVLLIQQEDGKPLPADALRRGVEFIREQRALGRPVLVQCGIGMSRSVTFVLAYLHTEGMDLRDALRLITQKRRQALPHVILLKSLIECYGASATPGELLTVLLKERKRLREESQ